MLLDGPDDPRLSRFISEFHLSPIAPEPGAPCHGGVDATDNPSRAR